MATTINQRRSFTRFSLFFICCLLILSSVLLLPMDAISQIVASFSLVMLIHFCASEAGFFHRHRQFFRLLALLLGLALTVRYLMWRGLYTMGMADIFSLIAMWALFLAEVYAGLTHIISCLVNVAPLTRPDKALTEADYAQAPTVDVYIPTYNEPQDLVEVTLRAALQLHYPKDKLNVYLLDDGGTVQKRQQADPAAALAARQRHQSLNTLCQELGARYLTREKNERAKAGNINSALAHTDGELVVILDADHVPTADFLTYTVPWMQHNPKVFLVQTPHFMANPDPVERNYFSAFTRMPSENDMFYGTIQKGLDFWNASFFCGSAAVLRRAHLMKVDGLSGDSVTEDAETAFDLHARGYESVYVNRPMVSGLAPETLNAFIQQRMRWAQGMTQILLLKKPHNATGLSWFQRFGYLSSILFWLFPFARIIFLLMPLAYLVFGLQVYRASLLEIVAYTIPHVIATYQLSTLLFGRTRWPLVSELYEILQCVFTLRALLKVFKNARAPSFVVTPKGESLAQHFISPLSGVFYALIALTLAGTVTGLEKLVNDPLTRELTVVVLAWNVFNLLLLLSVLSVLVERRQIREQARLPASDEITLRSDDGRSWGGHIEDMSLGGARARIRTFRQALPANVTLSAWSESAGRHVQLPCAVLFHNPKSGVVRFRFERADSKVWDEVIGFTMGDSRRWQSFQRRRMRRITYWYGVRHVLKVSVKPVVQHALMQLTRLWSPRRQVKE